MAEEKSALSLLPPAAVAPAAGVNGASRASADSPGRSPLRRLADVCLAARYMFAIQSCVGFAIIYGMKVNLAVAIVVMVNNTAFEKNETKNEGSGCPVPPSVKAEEGPFLWNEALQGHILSSYFYGYMVSQIPGAILAERFSSMWVMFGAVLCNVVGCVMTPPACYWHWSIVMALRIIQGLGGGTTFPAMHCLIAHWSPPAERSAICAIIYAGTALGTVISLLLSGFIAKGISWQWVFYLQGAMCVPWLISWPLMITDSPQKSKFIRDKERRMIKETIGDSLNEEKLPFPCKEVAKSLPFWAIIVGHVVANTGWYMFLTMLPKFMKQVLHKNVTQNAVVTAIPYFLLWIVSLSMGETFKRLIRAGKMKTLTARRIAAGITFIAPAACLVGITFIGCNDLAGTIIMVCGVTAYGAMFVGHLANHIDLSPNFAGMLMGITNTIATLPGILMPIGIGQLTKDSPTLERWSIAFYFVAVLNIFGFLFYFFCASGTVQPWNEAKEKGEGEEPAT